MTLRIFQCDDQVTLRIIPGYQSGLENNSMYLIFLKIFHYLIGDD